MTSIKKFKEAIHRLGMVIVLVLLTVSAFVVTPQFTYAEPINENPEAQILSPSVKEVEERVVSCDGNNPATYNPSSISTPRSTSVWGRKIELRYHGSSRCAWGRISNGSPGDEIWVDRSFNGGQSWQPKLGATQINSGSQKYTVMYNNRGNLMRACGKAGNRPEVRCTGWY